MLMVFHFRRHKNHYILEKEEIINKQKLTHTTSLPACEKAPLTEGCALVWGKTAAAFVSSDHIHLAGATALKSLSPKWGSTGSPQQRLLLQHSHS